MTLTVGFDLDMTLIDSRPGVASTMREVAGRTGFPIDADLVVSRLGPPLEQELAHWVPAERVTETSHLYREIYRDLGAGTLAMPGAVEALAAVRAAGGRSVVVTAKREDLARLCLAAVDLPVDSVAGWMWGAGKGPALRDFGASVYVGDHVLDVAAARAAGALAVAVVTGGTCAKELLDAGADVVLDDLRAFPGWLSGHLLEMRLTS